MSKQKSPSQTWFNVQEACDYLRISKPTLYELVRKGHLTSYTLQGAKARRFRREDLDGLLIPDESGQLGDEED